DTVFLSPNGGSLVWVSWGSPPGLWAWDFQRRRTPDRLHEPVFYNVAFSQDSRLMATSVDGTVVAIWDVARRSVIRRFSGHSAAPTAFAFSPGAERVVSGSNYPESEVRLWTTEGELIRRQSVHHNSIYDLAYSPDGLRIASASLDHTIGL